MWNHGLLAYSLPLDELLKHKIAYIHIVYRWEIWRYYAGNINIKLLPQFLVGNMLFSGSSEISDDKHTSPFEHFQKKILTLEKGVEPS